MKYLSKADEAALRVIAERHNIIATSGPHAGKGSTSQLLAGVINGDVVTVMLSDEQRAWLVEWLRVQSVADPLYRDAPRILADQIAVVPRTS